MPRFSRTVDLSHVVRQDVPYPPGEQPTRLARGPDGQLERVEIGARTGSLLRVMAAPHAEVADVERLSPRDLVLPAVMLDARDRAQDEPGFVFGLDDLVAWERKHGAVPRGALVLLATGWDLRWGDAAAYINAGSSGASQVPSFSAAAADLLLNGRGAAGLGLDAPATVAVATPGFWLLLENLTNLEQLPVAGITLVIGALKLQAAQSSPARVLALVP